MGRSTPQGRAAGVNGGMDVLSRIVAWLSDHEAAISAVVGIAVLAGIVFTGIRFLLRGRAEPATKTAPDEDPLLALIRE